MLWTSHPVYIYTCRLIVRINREYARRKVEYRRLNAGYRPSVIILIAGSFRREQNGSRKSEVRVASRQILFRWWRNSHGFSLSAFFHKEDEEEFCFFRNLIRLIRILCVFSRENSLRGAFRLRGKPKRKENIPIEPYTSSTGNGEGRESFEGGVVCKEVGEIYSFVLLRVSWEKDISEGSILSQGKRNVVSSDINDS